MIRLSYSSSSSKPTFISSTSQDEGEVQFPNDFIKVAFREIDLSKLAHIGENLPPRTLAKINNTIRQERMALEDGVADFGLRSVHLMPILRLFIRS